MALITPGNGFDWFNLKVTTILVFMHWIILWTEIIPNIIVFLLTNGKMFDCCGLLSLSNLHITCFRNKVHFVDHSHLLKALEALFFLRTRYYTNYLLRKNKIKNEHKVPLTWPYLTIEIIQHHSSDIFCWIKISCSNLADFTSVVYQKYNCRVFLLSTYICKCICRILSMK